MENTEKNCKNFNCSTPFINWLKIIAKDSNRKHGLDFIEEGFFEISTLEAAFLNNVTPGEFISQFAENHQSDVREALAA